MFIFGTVFLQEQFAEVFHALALFHFQHPQAVGLHVYHVLHLRLHKVDLHEVTPEVKPVKLLFQLAVLAVAVLQVCFCLLSYGLAVDAVFDGLHVLTCLFTYHNYYFVIFLRLLFWQHFHASCGVSHGLLPAGGALP